MHNCWGMSEEDALTAFLTWDEGVRSLRDVSSLMAVVRDARLVTGRESMSGALLPEQAQKAGSWLGALGYLVMIDQIGECFTRAGAPASSTREDFIRALELWAPSVHERQREACTGFAAHSHTITRC
jgi:hypothetical protein